MTSAHDDDLPPPQIEEALRRIAECKRTRADELHIGGLFLREIPEAVAELTWLKRLFCGLSEHASKKSDWEVTEEDKKSCNAVRALPARVATALQHLEELDLRFNQITRSEDLAEIGRLTALTHLWLTGNGLTALPPEIGRLTALTRLSLNDNGLTALPPEIGRLTALTDLYLDGNGLTALPPEIGRLTALTHLWLGGNPLHTPPIEVAIQGPKSVRAFFGEPRQPVYEAKVVLVGERAAGKTQLREWLVHGEFRAPGESTRVLEVRDVTFQNLHDPAKAGRMNIWDFGGDDDYRPSQQLFFTRGALYLMLFNARNTMAQGRVEDWLRLVRLRVGAGARVLLVGTNWVEGDQLPNLNALPADLRGMCVTQADGRPFLINSKDEKGRPIHGLLGAGGLLDRVRSEVASLMGFKAEYPTTWLAARDTVLDPRSYAADEGATATAPPKAIWYRMDEDPARTTFHKLSRRAGVADGHVPIVARALSDTGRLTFKGDPKRPLQWVVLDSEWLMKAVGYVLSAAEVRENGGVFERKHFMSVWRTHARRAAPHTHTPYDASVHDELVRQMALHDICYKLDDDRWLVPQCVSANAPATVPWTFPDRAHDGVSLRLVCSMTDKIHGLAAVLTARNSLHHPSVMQNAWQTGFFVRKTNGKAEGLVRVDGENKVDMETRGPEALDFRAELKGSLDKLMHDVWPAASQMEVLPYTYSVPCPTCGNGSYNLDDLTKDFRSNERVSKCEGGKRCRHEVFELLNGFSVPVDRETREARRFRSNEPPHIITVTKVPRVGGMLGHTIKIDVHCEYDDTGGPVRGATETIPFDSKIWGWLKEWGPGLFKTAAKAVAYGDVTDLDIPDRRRTAGADQSLAAALEKTGRIERPENRQVPDELRDVLLRAAAKGNMRQVEMRNTGYLLWVSPEIADGQDPNVAKSKLRA